MTTLPHLMRQPRSRRFQRRHRRRVLLAVLLGAALISAVYLIHEEGTVTYYKSTKTQFST